VAGQLHVGGDFLPLTEVEVFLSAKKSEHMASTYIRKANILFVAERVESQPKTANTKDTPKIYPVREKKPIGVKVYMSLYTLTGKMHSEMWQQLLDTLNKDERFLPLTGVEISPPLASGESKFSFAAINKDQIIYVGEQ